KISAGAGGADHERERRQGFHRRELRRRPRAHRYAAGDRRPAAEGACRGAHASGDAGQAARARLRGGCAGADGVVGLRRLHRAGIRALARGRAARRAEEGIASMPRQVRRVVTGHRDGKAVVISDGPAPFVHVNAVNPEWYSTDIWRTHECPAKIVAKAEEPTLGPRRQMPTRCGTVLRINNFPPETEAVRLMDAEASRKAFAALGNEKAATFGKGGRHPLMHRTETIDYALVLSGEIT